jgi:hypothetical protein
MAKIKTSHAGPKRGRGAFYGPRQVAKAYSDRRRREEAKESIYEQLAEIEDCSDNPGWDCKMCPHYNYCDGYKEYKENTSYFYPAEE